MEWLVATAIGVCTAAGVFLILGRRSFDVVLGLGLLSYAVNCFIFVMGRLSPGAAPILAEGAPGYADPLPQALVLTAIVIGFAMQALVLALAMTSFAANVDDHVDAGEDNP
jgi:multicomponent K+:H+ antiporter subunit C